MSFDLLDKDGGEIRVTAWNDQVDQYNDQVQVRLCDANGGGLSPASTAGHWPMPPGWPGEDAWCPVATISASLTCTSAQVGKVYTVSKASLKPKNARFNNTNHEFEVSSRPGPGIQGHIHWPRWPASSHLGDGDPWRRPQIYLERSSLLQEVADEQDIPAIMYNVRIPCGALLVLCSRLGHWRLLNTVPGCACTRSSKSWLSSSRWRRAASWTSLALSRAWMLGTS